MRSGLVLAALALPGPLAVAEVRLAVAAPDIMSGSNCALRPSQSGQDALLEAPSWAFSVKGPGGGTFSDELGDFFFRAPVVQTLTSFEITAWDTRNPLEKARARVMVTPLFAGVSKPSPIKKRMHNRHLTDAYMAPWYFFKGAAQDTATSSASSSPKAEALAPDFIQEGPMDEEDVALEPIGGEVMPFGAPSRFRFQDVSALAVLEHDDAMKDLNNAWIVGDAQGLKVLTMSEEARVLADRPLGVSALATRPWFSEPSNPLHVVFAETTPLLPAPAAASGLSLTSLSASSRSSSSDGSRFFSSIQEPASPGLSETHSAPSTPWLSTPRTPSCSSLTTSKTSTFSSTDSNAIDSISEGETEGLGVIWSYGPDGVPAVYAGTATPDPKGATFQDGPRLEARFGQISGLAMDADGTLFVADAGNRLIRRISPEGRVTTVAGNPLALRRTQATDPDGKGAHATFTQLAGLTLDLVTRDLLVADGHAIRRITPESAEVATLLGVVHQEAYLSSNPGEGLPGRVPCLHTPQSLQVRGENLFFADQGNHAIRVFNLRTRALRTVFGGPDQAETRFGLLPKLNAGPLSPTECAGIASPKALAISYQAYCALGLPDGLASVDFQRLILGRPTSKPKYLLEFPRLLPTPSPTAPPMPQGAPLDAIPFNLQID